MKEYKIGRLPSNDIVINEPTVSKHHALLRIDQIGVTLTDLNSTNGTFVNGNRVEESIQLNELDIVKLGLVLFDWNDYVNSTRSEQNNVRYQNDSEPEEEPRQERQEERDEPVVVQQSVYNSPSTTITQKSTNYTPLIIFVVILGFVGLAALIIAISENSGVGSDVPYSVTDESSKNDNKFTTDNLIGKWILYEDYDTHGKTKIEGSIVFRGDGTYLGIDNGEIEGGGNYSFDDELMILTVSEKNEDIQKVELEVLNTNEVLIKGKHKSGTRWTALMERQQ
jgi:pSer/pThr/pTyr-binding forkhead associated (FHA) protein